MDAKSKINNFEIRPALKKEGIAEKEIKPTISVDVPLSSAKSGSRKEADELLS
jgi:hypothetical protein